MPGEIRSEGPQPDQGRDDIEGEVIEFTPKGQKLSGKRTRPVEKQIREATHSRFVEGNKEVPPWVTSKSKSPQFEHDVNDKGETQAETEKRRKEQERWGVARDFDIKGVPPEETQERKE
jgi:hypothetical protein